MSRKTLNRQFAGRIAALLATSTLFIIVSAFAQTGAASESSLFARCNERAMDTYVSAFEVTAHFRAYGYEPESRLFCTPQSKIAGNRADVAWFDIFNDAGMLASTLILGSVQVARGYMLTVFTEIRYAGANRYYDGDGEVKAPPGMRIGSLMVRGDPIVSACGGDRSVKVVIWNQERFTSSLNVQPHCLRQDRRGLEEATGTNFITMGSVHVDRAYKLIVFRKKNFEGTARVFFSDDADTIVGGVPVRVKSYLLVPSVALESVEETDEGVVLSYSRINAGSHSVVIPRASSQVWVNEDEPWQDMETRDGEDGAVGPRGPQGEAGPAGQDGEDGAVGPRGPQGEAGPTGQDGEDGAVGARGPQGEAGLAGQDGAAGEAGARGPQGETGPAGQDGAAGEAGPPGRDGKNGVGQVALFDRLTSSCEDRNKGVIEYDRTDKSLLVCDGAEWFTLPLTQSLTRAASTRLDFPPIEELGSATSLGGWGHTCALLDHGEAECWGDNSHGQTNVPAGLSGRVRQIAAGWSHTCAVTGDGDTECWGLNRNGRTNVPANLAGRVRWLAVGGHHTCAVTVAGNAECWGWKGHGQTNVPTNLAGRVRQIAAGVRHTCALTADRKAECWGSNTQGQTTVPAGLAGRVRQIAAGSSHTCAVTAAGNAECWGDNGQGQTTVPAGLAGRVRQIAAGRDHTCAVTDDRNAECWGYNYQGQTTVPAGLAGRVRQIAAGSSHTCAVLDDGHAKCWGLNGNGQTNMPTGLAGRIRQF